MIAANDQSLFRRTIEAEIERLIALLDGIDGEPDLEENGDCEPSLGWPNAHDTRSLDPNFVHLGAVDIEQDNADYEDGGDTEPNGDELDANFSEDGL